MKTIKIKVYNEVHATWLKMMLEREIEEVKGTIDNEELFKKGSDGEDIIMHEMNIQNLLYYQRELETALLAMDDV